MTSCLGPRLRIVEISKGPKRTFWGDEYVLDLDYSGGMDVCTYQYSLKIYSIYLYYTYILYITYSIIYINIYNIVVCKLHLQIILKRYYGSLRS